MQKKSRTHWDATTKNYFIKSNWRACAPVTFDEVIFCCRIPMGAAFFLHAILQFYCNLAKR